MASLGRTCVATASSWSEYLSAKGLPTIPPPAEAALKLAACTVRSVVADASALVFATWERASVTSPLGAVLMVAMLLAAAGLANASKWLLFLVVSFVLSLLQQIWATWQFVRISSGLVIIGALKAGMLIYEAYRTAALSVLAVASRRAGSRRQRKRAVAFASSYAAYAEAACAASGDAPGPADGPAEPLLRATVGDLVAARESGDPQRLRFALSAVLKRNHLGIENEENVAHLAVASFRAEVMRSLDALAANEASSPTDRLRFFRRQQHALGGTALCLSGGGSLTSYHIGVLKGLIESKLLSKIKVFSGTSGGSIMAAMVASRTEQELTEFVLVPSFGGDFRQDGTQTSEFVFFPSLREQLVSFLRYRRLVPSGHFSRACKWYWGDVTFEEAYEKTGRHVCIMVSAQNIGGSKAGPQRLLLNHISTPHVTLASAVAASCALPGIMDSQILEAKNSAGELTRFGVDGVDWCDGSLQADVPFQRISTMFNVSFFIVSQVNPHIVPFLRKDNTPGDRSTWWRLYEYLQADVRHRIQALAKLGLLPTFFGHPMGKIFEQKYHGDCTLIPNMPFSDAMSLKVIMNPPPAELARYILGGQKALWPHVERIRGVVALEDALSECIAMLRSEPERLRSLDKHNVARMHKSHSLNAVQLACETGRGGGGDDGDSDDWEHDGARTPVQLLEARLSHAKWENSCLRKHALRQDVEITMLRTNLKAVGDVVRRVPVRLANTAYDEALPPSSPRGIGGSGSSSAAAAASAAGGAPGGPPPRAPPRRSSGSVGS